ncbi:MAG: hypothetical protein J0L89_03890 [Xanthomonadales bacterium]|nr:hypothetical protein [Xanthomonadales bacterium]
MSAIMEDAYAVRPAAGQSFGWLDHVLCWALVALATAWAYHPYFFGDEIIQFRDLMGAQGFVEALRRMSEYKPRLVYNSLWAWGVTGDWARWQFAVASAACMAAVCSLVAQMAVRWFAASRLLVWVLVAGILVSRFAAMLYFDYIAGLIESMSLMLFLATMWVSVAALRTRGMAPMLLAVSLAVATALVHERYVAATFAMGVVVVAWALVELPRGSRSRAMLFAGALALLPVAAYLVLHHLLAARSLATGTAGQEVSIDLGTAKVFLTYMANVLLGTNFGNEWLVGSLNMASPGGRSWSIAFAAAFLVAWGLHAWSIRHDRGMLGRALALLAIVGALGVMASLPGESRQEGRWLHPMATLSGLLVLCARQVAVRYLLLSLFIAVSLLHWTTGSLDTIYNLIESRNARNISQGINRLRPQANYGVVFGMDYSRWTFGDSPDAVAEFSRRNLGGQLLLEFFEPGDERQLARAEVGFVRLTPVDYGKGAQFASVNGIPLRILMAPETAEAYRGRVGDAVVLGEGADWGDGWQWTRPPEQLPDGIVLEAADRVSGFLAMPAADLDGREISYRARLRDAGPASRMRLQVNWLGADGVFISTMIRVVEVDPATHDHRAMLAAPFGAIQGLVYANLHDGEDRPVVLESISLRAPAMIGLGSADDWGDWHWTGTPRFVDGEGVVLGRASELVGTQALDARTLNGRVLVYRARTLEPGRTSNLRLQVNWVGPGDAYLGTQIQTVEVGIASSNHPMLMTAPAGAVKGVVYANLHDGEDTQVLLQSVDIFNAR